MKMNKNENIEIRIGREWREQRVEAHLRDKMKSNRVEEMASDIEKIYRTKHFKYIEKSSLANRAGLKLH